MYINPPLGDGDIVDPTDPTRKGMNQQYANCFEGISTLRSDMRKPVKVKKPKAKKEPKFKVVSVAGGISARKRKGSPVISVTGKIHKKKKKEMRSKRQKRQRQAGSGW